MNDILTNSIKSTSALDHVILEQNCINNGQREWGTKYDCSGHIIVVKSVYGTFGEATQAQAKRGAVSKFSFKSAANMRRYLRTCCADYVVFGTLTYPAGYSIDGEVIKEHLRIFLQRLRRYHQLFNTDTFANYSTFWFLEFQERGAPHFHFFTTHRIPHQWLANTWYEIVGSEDKRHLQAGTSVEAIRSGRRGMSKYASKYAAKQTQKEVPEEYRRVGRFWGVSGLRTTKTAAFTCLAGVASDPGSNRRRNKVDEAIKSAIKSGKIHTIGRRQGIWVGYITCDKVQKDLFVKIQLAGAMSRGESPLACTQPQNMIDARMDADERLAWLSAVSDQSLEERGNVSRESHKMLYATS